MRVHNLFPTPIGFFDIGREFTKKELDFINELEQRPNMGNTTSKNSYVLEDKKLKGIKEFVEQRLHIYLSTVYVPRNDLSLKITQSWFNYTKPGQYHHKHAHPNSFVSMVLYINTDENDKIFFFKDGYTQIKIPTDTFNDWNSDSWWFEAKQGQLIMFPSSLTHLVETKSGVDTRISLAINTFPMGYIGEDNDLTGLHLKE